MKLKRMIAVLLALLVLLSATGCGGIAPQLLEQAKENAAQQENESGAAQKEPEAPVCVISCVDQDGRGIENAKLQICRGDSCSMVETDMFGEYELELTDGEITVTLYSVPEEYVIEQEQSLTADSSAEELTFTARRRSEEEIQSEASAPEITEYEAVEFETLDSEGSTVDSSVFSQAELTMFIMSICDGKNNFIEAMLELAQPLSEQYGDRLNVVLVLGKFKGLDICPLTVKELKGYVDKYSVPYLTLSWCDALAPFANLYYNNVLYVNAEGRAVRPVYEEYDESNAKRIEEVRGYVDSSKYPEWLTRSGECIIGSGDATQNEIYVCALLGENLRRYELEKQRGEYLDWLNDLSSLEVDTVDWNGEHVDSSIFEGRKLVMINMWEPWCGPCKSELADLEKLYGKYQDEGFLIIGAYSTEDGAAKIIKQKGLTYPNLVMWDGLARFRSGSVPTTIFLDGEGNVLKHTPDASDSIYPENLQGIIYVGSRSFEDWENIVLGYLN